MIEFLSNHILWWHWIVLGLFLILLELQDGSFLMLGLGSAAILTGVINYYLKPEFTTELIVWAALSVLYIFAWKKFIHDKIKGAKVGQSDEFLGEVGIVISPISKFREGKVRFDVPVVGARVWIAMSDEDIPVGEEVELIEILGQYAKVKKLKKDKDI